MAIQNILMKFIVILAILALVLAALAPIVFLIAPDVSVTNTAIGEEVENKNSSNN